MRRVAISLACLGCACGATPEAAFHAPRAAAASSRNAAAKMLGPAQETAGTESLKQLASKLNPVLGYYDPLKLGGRDFWVQGNDATIGWLRHSEIKHGRVAMAAFVGYVLQSNGWVFPWKLTGSISFKDIAAAGSPPEQWDALPLVAKLQILAFIGFLEGWSENSWVLEQEGNTHYMRGGVPGKFPSFSTLWHPVPLDLYDPFKLNIAKTPEEQERNERRLLAEINNGRLAMFGILGCLAEQKLSGAVPLLKGLVPYYEGCVMNPLMVPNAAERGLLASQMAAIPTGLGGPNR